MSSEPRETAIPFNRPCVAGEELACVEEAIRRGHAASDGFFTQQCCEFLERTLGVSKAILTTSGTHALELAALLLELQPGDEVIVPSFTFVSTANAFVLRGAKPVFVDSQPDTLNMDETLLERALTKRTRAVVPVHYAGVGCNVDVMLELGARKGIVMIEDNAHGLFGKFRGRPLGTWGALAALSFHETKNISCGEGGALLINDARYRERADVISQKGTNRSRFFRSEVDKYTWVDLGSSYRLSDLLAAYLFAQLEAGETIQRKRRAVWEYYRDHLEGWAKEHEVRIPHVPVHCDQSYHMFYLLLPSPAQRPRMIAHLRQHGINSVFHYQPLHLSEMGRRFGARAGDCPVAEEVSERLLRLPFFNDLTGPELARVVESVRDFEAW